MRHVFVFLIFLSLLAIKNVLSQGTSSNNVALTIHIKEGFKPSFNDPLSSDYANLTQRIRNFINQSMVQARINGLLSTNINSLTNSSLDYIFGKIATTKAVVSLAFNQSVALKNVQAAIDNQANNSTGLDVISSSYYNISKDVKNAFKFLGFSFLWFIVVILAISICCCTCCGVLIYCIFFKTPKTTPLKPLIKS